MTSVRESILLEIGRLQQSINKIEYKSRRLFEESGGNPPPETILQYDMYITGDRTRLQELRKKLESLYPVPV